MVKKEKSPVAKIMNSKVRFCCIAVVFLFIMMLLSTNLNAQDSAIVRPGSTVLLIGDSLGVGLSHRFKQLAKEYGYIPYSHVINGSQTIQWRRYIDADIDKYKPSLVIISLGTNDAVLSDTWVLKHADDYKILSDKIKAGGADVVWIGPPKMKSSRIQSQEMVMSLIKERVVFYYDSTLIDFNRSLDGIHSTPSGYSMWMDSVWSWMASSHIVIGGC